MKILFAGDYCPQERVANLLKTGKVDTVFGEVNKYTSLCDYSVVNLECPIAYGKEKSPLDRLSLSCGKWGLDALKQVGFDCVTLANNHFRDKGGDGVNNTIETCKEYGIDHVGGGYNLNDASTVLYKKIGVETVAIVNCCEHEFSLATVNRGGANPLNPIRQFHAIKEARKNANYVIVIVHGGHEHWQLPSPRMVETYRYFVEVGADAVINHHQHCYSGYERYMGKMIFYGIGNFCFDNLVPPSKNWHIGYLVSLSLNDEVVDYEIYPYVQCRENPKVEFIPLQEIEESIENLNQIIINEDMLREKTEAYYSVCDDVVKTQLFPINNRWIKGLWRRGLFPSLSSKKWLMYLCDFVMCESHRDKMEHYFEHSIY